jgi:hypothetical protein
MTTGMDITAVVDAILRIDTMIVDATDLRITDTTTTVDVIIRIITMTAAANRIHVMTAADVMTDLS